MDYPFLYDIYLKVPLIIYDLKAPAQGLWRTEPITLLDIVPAILGRMGYKRR
jgi:arylsulfatase A-like enzyme